MWGARVALVVGVLLVLALIGPPGHAYRANDEFGACVAGLQGQIEDPDSGAPSAEYIACVEICDPEPSRLHMLGRWAYLRIAYDGGAACSDEVELADIFFP